MFFKSSPKSNKTTADELLELMYLWMKKGKLCARELRHLAKELESLRKKCNVAETAGNTVAVAGCLTTIGAGVAIFLTGGAAAPVVGLIAAASSIVGTGVTVASKITEHFSSSSKLKNVQEIDKDCRRIGEKIKRLHEKLKSESPDHQDPDEQEKHVVYEFLKAFAKHKELTDPKYIENINDFLSDFMKQPNLVLLHQGLTVGLLVEVLAVLQFFALNVRGKILQGVLVGAGELAKDVGLVGARAVMKGGLAILGGFVGLAFSLPDAIKTWGDAIKNNHETKASRSLRDTAKSIDDAIEKLTNRMDKTETLLKEAIHTWSQKSFTTKDCQQEKSRGETNPSRGTQENREAQTRPAKGYESLCDQLKAINKAWIVQRQRVSQQGAAPPGGGGGGGGGGKKPVEEEDSSEEESSSSEDETGQKKDRKKKRDSRRVLNMGLVNARSVCNKDTTENLNILLTRSRLDFLLITETWLNRDSRDDIILRRLLPHNTRIIHVPRPVGQGGGVAIVFSDQLEFRQINLSAVAVDSFEYVAGVVSHPSWDHPVVIICIYHPTSTNREQLEYFLLELELLLFNVYENYSHRVIVAGDFNIWVDEEGEPRRVFRSFLRRSRLEQFVHEPTHRHGHTLDLVLSRNVDIPVVTVWDDNISDHFTVNFKAKPLSTKEAKKKAKKEKKRQEESRKQL